MGKSKRWIEIRQINIWQWMLFHIPLAILASVVTVVLVSRNDTFDSSAYPGAVILPFVGMLCVSLLQGAIFNLSTWLAG
ncbi:MAG: hypothetical protein EHM48_06345, partial [Planctomycetaceae bacterium]